MVMRFVAISFVEMITALPISRVSQFFSAHFLCNRIAVSHFWMADLISKCPLANSSRFSVIVSSPSLIANSWMSTKSQSM